MCQRATLQAPLTKSIFLKPMNITETSRKDEVITSACELVDQQDAVIKTLKQQQQVLFYLLGGLTIISLIF